MTDFILGVFEITIGMSLFIALLLIGLKLFGGKFTAKCRYIIWALVMLRLAIPFSFGLLPTLIEIPIDTELVQSEDLSSILSENTDSVTSVQPSDPGDVVVTPTTPSTPVFPNVDTAKPGSTPILPVTPTVPGDQAEPVIPSDPVVETPTEQPVSLRQILDIAGIVYLTGAAIFLVWSLVSYFIYTRKILHSAKAADDRTQKIFSTICKKYGMKKQPTLLVASGIHSPAAFGIFRRKIVLPDIVFSENGLVGTLAHEVTHCKRGDLYMKLVELIACSLNWFNPLVHIAAFQCEMEMELSCDEKVLSGSSEAARAAYADVMLDIIRRCRRNRGALTTHFNPKKSAVTARFKNILYGSGKRRGRILIGICLVLCVLAGAFVACQTGDDLPDDIDYAEGIYIKDIAGADMVLIDGTSPCTFWGADGVVIEGLTDGDRIRIGVREFLDSSPMQAEVYSIEKLSDGTIDDIDPAVLDSLHELGWIEADNSVTNHGQGPFIGYVADAQTPWVDLYTEINGTYVGRIPYEIFNGWPATDRNSEGWTPGWEPDYMKYYYAEFDDFRWAAVHLESTVLGSGRVNIATSSDGGNTWTCGNYTDDYGGNHVVGIGFASSSVGIMCFNAMYEHGQFTDSEMVLPIVLSRTEDSGKTWERMEIAVPDGWENYRTRPSVPVFDGASGWIPVVRYDKTAGEEVDTVYLVSADAGRTWKWEVPKDQYTGENEENIDVVQVFHSVLENKYPVVSSEKKQEMLLKDYLASYDFPDDIQLSINKYSIIDLNDDGVPEMILWLRLEENEYYGFAVLHYNANAVYIHEFTHRAFNELKTDGTYTSSSSAFNMSILKLDFKGGACISTRIAHREGDGSLESITYYIEDHIVTAEEFEKLSEKQNQKEDIIWIDMPVDYTQTTNEDILYSVLEDKTLVYSLSAEHGVYLSELFQNHGDTYPIAEYSIIDLNGDRTSEFVLIKSSGNYTILHVEDNKVYAHSLPYRSFLELKEDGTFVWSGGASDWGIGRIDFDRYNQTRENLAFCRYDYDTKAEVYSIENRTASKEEFDACYAAQGQKPDAVWHEWTAQQETSAQPIDFSSIGGDWYHSFNYEGWYAFYGLNFRSQTAEMQFDHGLYESEYAHRYSGTYTVDPATQEITAVLHDGRYIHNDPDITIKFTIKVQTEQNNQTLILHILACDVPRYQHLVGKSLEFTREFGYAELEYQTAQNYYQMWYDKELTVDTLLDKSAVKRDIAKKIMEATGIKLLVPGYTWEYAAAEDRFPLRFFVPDGTGKKMIETNIIRYKDEQDGMEKYAVEVNPTVISVE